MTILGKVAEEHRTRLVSHVEGLPALADDIGRLPWPEVAARLADEHDFLTSTLIPHMEKVESAVHAELDRLLSCRLGMEPLDREHRQIRELIDRMAELAPGAPAPEPAAGELIELHRIIVKLHSILKVHLREESLYIPILERNLTVEQADAIARAMEHAARVEL